MPKLKPVVLKSKVSKDKTTNIKIRLTHNHKSREIATPYYIPPAMMGKDGQVKGKHPNAMSINGQLSGMIAGFTEIINSIGIREVENMDINSLVNRLRKTEAKGVSFTDHVLRIEQKLREENRDSYADNYRYMLRACQRFKGRDKIYFDEINYQFVEEFESFLKIQTVHQTKLPTKTNTIRIYLWRMKEVIDHARKLKLISTENPLSDYEIRKEKSKRESLTPEEVIKLRIGPYHRAQQRSVHLFFLSFYCLGMNLKDLLYLPSNAIRNGYIMYKRLKIEGKQDVELRFKVIPEALCLFELYKGEKYLLRFLDEDDSYETYKSFLKETNHTLRKAGVYAGITTRITTGITRHTWATIALGNDVAQSDVDLALAHDLNSMLAHYKDYKKLMQRVDVANEVVQKAICPD